MTKRELRIQFKQKRKELTPEKLEELSKQLCDQFFSHVLLNPVRVLHIFLPIQTFQEPDTWLLIHRLQREYPRIKIVLPKVMPDGSLQHFVFAGEHQLQQSEWGIHEPILGEEVSPESIDVVIVPLLCFDLNGNRVGYGKGFYDSFLKQCAVTCLTVGLSLFEPVSLIQDVDVWDVPLKIVLTPVSVRVFA